MRMKKKEKAQIDKSTDFEWRKEADSIVGEKNKQEIKEEDNIASDKRINREENGKQENEKER